MHVILAGDWEEARDYAVAQGWKFMSWRYMDEAGELTFFLDRGEVDDITELPGLLEVTPL